MEFKLPEIGEGIHEGELVRWLVKEGDTIAVDQPLAEIMTDKATVEVPSPHAGKVTKLLGKEGDVFKVGQVVLEFEPAQASAQKSPAAGASAAKGTTPASAAQSAAARAASAPASGARPSASSSPTQAVAPTPPRISTPVLTPELYIAEPGRVLATPATRRLARTLGLDLRQVPGTGPAGRVTKEDLQRYAGASAAGPAIPVSGGRPAAGAAALGGARQVVSAPSQATGLGGLRSSSPALPAQRETLVPFRGIRRKIAEAMTKSRQTIPEFTYVDECDISELVAFRKEAKALAEKQGIKLTYMPFICKAAIRALRDFPMMNATLDEHGGNVIVKNYYNIGVAVDTDDGLIVPVVKNADQKSILELAHEMQALADKARSRRLTVEDLQGGTFTITNAGNIGGMLATPIINWPEVAILGVHKISRRPVVRVADGRETVAIGDVIWLSAAIDHRVVDGAMAARFMNVVMDYLSHPKKMMLEMS